MAKGQMRSNREKKKPKANAKVKTIAANSSTSQPTTVNIGKGSKSK